MRYLKVFFLILCLSIFTVACGSSGDNGGNGGNDGSESSGDDSAIRYTGLTTQATIDQSNAQDISAGAYQGGVTSSALTASGVIQSENTMEVGRPRILVLSQILEEALQKIDVTSHSAADFSGATETATETIPGDCGGEATINMSYDDATGDFNGTLTFNSYCSEGVIISGSTDFSGKFDGEYYSYFNLSFNSISAVSGGDSFTSCGTMNFDFTVSPAVATINMSMKDNMSGKVYKIEDFRMTFDGTNDYVDICMTGRFYDPDHGYVDLSTPDTFRFYGADEWPSEGKLVIDGEGGTSAALIALSPSLCEINADTDGDGTFDYSSGQMPWTDL